MPTQQIILLLLILFLVYKICSAQEEYIQTKTYTRYFGIRSPDMDELDIQLNLIVPSQAKVNAKIPPDEYFQDVLTRFTTKNKGFKISGIYANKKTGKYIDNLKDLKYSNVYGYESLESEGPHIVLTYDVSAPLNEEGLVPIQVEQFDGYRQYDPVYLKSERMKNIMKELQLLTDYNVPKDIGKYIIPEYVGYDYYEL